MAKSKKKLLVYCVHSWSCEKADYYDRIFRKCFKCSRNWWVDKEKEPDVVIGEVR